MANMRLCFVQHRVGVRTCPKQIKTKKTSHRNANDSFDKYYIVSPDTHTHTPKQKRHELTCVDVKDWSANKPLHQAHHQQAKKATNNKASKENATQMVLPFLESVLQHNNFVCRESVATFPVQCPLRCCCFGFGFVLLTAALQP